MFSKSSNFCKKNYQSLTPIDQVLYYFVVVFLVVKRPCFAYSDPLVVYQYKYLRSCLLSSDICRWKKRISTSTNRCRFYVYKQLLLLLFRSSLFLVVKRPCFASSLLVSLTLKLKQKEFHAYRIPQKHWGIQK